MNADTTDTPLWGIPQIEAYFERSFPQVARGKSLYATEYVSTKTARMRLLFDEMNLRPGGTIQGPALMSLADLGSYVVILGAYGETATGAVTTSLQMDFLRKPEPGDLVAHSELVKPGRRLAVCHVRICSADGGDPVAVASCTYAVPSKAP